MNRLMLLFILASGGLYAQSPVTDNISWKSYILFDSTDRASMPFVSEFRVYPSKKKIDWMQNNNSYVTTFSISSVQGGWTDLSKDGKAVFSVSYFGRNGQLVIERLNGLTRVALYILENGKNLLPLSLTINTVTNL